MICKKCTQSIPDGVKFCPICGAAQSPCIQAEEAQPARCPQIPEPAPSSVAYIEGPRVSLKKVKRVSLEKVKKEEEVEEPQRNMPPQARLPQENKSRPIPLIIAGIVVGAIVLGLLIRVIRSPKDTSPSGSLSAPVQENVREVSAAPEGPAVEAVPSVQEQPRDAESASHLQETPVAIKPELPVPEMLQPFEEELEPMPEPPPAPVLCSLEVENSYQAPLHVYQDGQEIAVVGGNSSVTLSGLQEDSEVEVRLFAYDVTEPYFYTCRAGSNHIVPSGFTFTQEHQSGIHQAVLSYIEDTVRIYNLRDMATLEQVTSTELSRALISDLRYEMSFTMEKDGYTYIFQMLLKTPQQVSSSFGADDTPTADVVYNIPFNDTKEYTYKNGNVVCTPGSYTIQDPFVVQYNGSGWAVVD